MPISRLHRRRSRCAGCRSRRPRRVSRRRRRCRGSRRRAGRRTAAAAKIGRIPPRALQLKPGSGHLFFKCRFAAARAFGQLRIRYLLQHILGKTTRFAAISINRHQKSPQKSSKTLNYNGFWGIYVDRIRTRAAIRPNGLPLLVRATCSRQIGSSFQFAGVFWFRN